MQRRDFLKAAGAGAALGLAGNLSGAASGMFIALNTSLVGGKVQWPEFARLAAKVGYGGTDVDLGRAMQEGVDATKELLAELKIRPSFCSLPVNATRDEETFRKGMDGFEKQVKFAAAIGCRRMMVVIPPSSPTPKDELRKTLQERFTAVGKVLGEHGVRCGFEFLGPLHFRPPSQHVFIYQMNEMADFASECGSSFGIVLDDWHWYHSGATLADIRRAGANRIELVHLSDAAKMPPEEVRDNVRLLAGEGVIDLVGFFRTLKEMNWAGSVSPEPIGRIPKEMSAEEGAKLGLDSARAVMRKAGIDVG